jgi:KDO2-lipid IV(A) lauroyltransferase
MKNILFLAQAAIFYILTLMAAMIPASISFRLGTLAGLMIPILVPKRRAIAVDNISRALPFMKAHPLWDSSIENAEELAQETFKNLGRSLMEVCHLYHGRGEDIIARVEVRGIEHFEAAHARGKGAIFLTGHCGNWELASLAFSRLFGKAMSVVARRQNNPYLNRMVEKMRMNYNNRVIYKQGALKGMLSVLKKGGTIGLLADQAVFPEDGVLIDVLGRKAWASKAPAIIGQKSGAAVLPAFIHREDGRFVITFHPAHCFSGDMSDEGIRNETQALSRYVEDYIVAHPTQWYWVHRRWKRAGEEAT